MSWIKEFAEALKLLGDVVDGTSKIIEAVNDGRAYVKRYHPDAVPVLNALLKQMQLAIEGLSNVTKVMSSFRFVVTTGAQDLATASSELARFNGYVVEQNSEVAKLRGGIRDLKADCERVRELRDQLDAKTRSRSWGSMFELFGNKARQRSQELHSSLSNFYADDQRMIELLDLTLKLAELGLAEPPRLCRRLLCLRRGSHGTSEQVLTGGAGAGGAAGAGAAGRA